MDSCVFCKIINGDIPSLKIYEDANYLAFLDISQFTPGHTLIIPKSHIRFVWDSPKIEEYFRVVQKIAHHYQKLGYTYVDSLSFGRMVPHAHVHLIPHNDNSQDYQQAMAGIGALQTDPSRHPSAELGAQLVAKFKL
jgi:histidine triad (HIT) family protein